MNLAQISAELVGTKYELGKHDCFSVAVEYLKKRGMEIPESFMGLTIDTYKHLFLKDPKKAKEIMLDFVESLMTEIPIHKVFAGDVMLLSLKNSTEPPFLAINGGNGNIIAASKEFGVSVTGLKYYRIEKAFRCPK